MEAQKLRTSDEILADWANKGISLRGWSHRHGLCHATVRGVLTGRLSGRIGESHKAAVLLGLKHGEIVEESSRA